MTALSLASNRKNRRVAPGQPADVADYEGPLLRFVQERLLDVAYRVPFTVRDACNQCYSGAYLLETMPSVL